VSVLERAEPANDRELKGNAVGRRGLAWRAAQLPQVEDGLRAGVELTCREELKDASPLLLPPLGEELSITNRSLSGRVELRRAVGPQAPLGTTRGWRCRWCWWWDRHWMDNAVFGYLRRLPGPLGGVTNHCLPANRVHLPLPNGGLCIVAKPAPTKQCSTRCEQSRLSPGSRFEGHVCAHSSQLSAWLPMGVPADGRIRTPCASSRHRSPRGRPSVRRSGS
jgi:hypothetical protein